MRAILFPRFESRCQKEVGLWSFQRVGFGTPVVLDIFGSLAFALSLEGAFPAIPPQYPRNTPQSPSQSPRNQPAINPRNPPAILPAIYPQFYPLFTRNSPAIYPLTSTRNLLATYPQLLPAVCLKVAVSRRLCSNIEYRVVFAVLGSSRSLSILSVCIPSR